MSQPEDKTKISGSHVNVLLCFYDKVIFDGYQCFVHLSVKDIMMMFEDQIHIMNVYLTVLSVYQCLYETYEFNISIYVNRLIFINLCVLFCVHGR